MNDSFYFYGVPSSSSFHQKPSFRGIPVAAPKPKASPKVISIPVHFVGSERTRSDSALKIQKVLRGFLVRKNLKKIAAMSNEVDQIETKISDRETIDLIRRDSRERLRISETLMNLLLRLDSVTSVDFGVRGCRKSVIKKAIALQEKLDLIASGAFNNFENETLGCYTDNTKVESHEEEEAGDYGNGCSEEISEINSRMKPEDEEAMAVNNVEAAAVCVPSEVMSAENAGQEISTVTDNSSLENETIVEVKEANSLPEMDEEAERDGVRREEQNEERKLLGRMAEENERMMGLMAELCERNAIQMRLLSSLSDRVQKLEKAFVCEKLRKKKRRNGVCDKLPENKKCDKKL